MTLEFFYFNLIISCLYLSSVVFEIKFFLNSSSVMNLFYSFQQVFYYITILVMLWHSFLKNDCKEFKRLFVHTTLGQCFTNFCGCKLRLYMLACSMLAKVVAYFAYAVSYTSKMCMTLAHDVAVKNKYIYHWKWYFIKMPNIKLNIIRHL